MEESNGIRNEQSVLIETFLLCLYFYLYIFILRDWSGMDRSVVCRVVVERGRAGWWGGGLEGGILANEERVEGVWRESDRWSFLPFSLAPRTHDLIPSSYSLPIPIQLRVRV